MPIRPFLAEPTAFQPEAVEAMSKAFDAVCVAIHLGPDDTREREVIAERIIDLGRLGMLDANTIRDRILSERLQLETSPATGNEVIHPPCPKCGRATKLVITMPDVTTPSQELRIFKCDVCGYEHETQASF